MGWTIQILAFTIIIVSSVNCCKENQTFSSNMHCSVFYRCLAGKKHLYACPSGRHYSTATGSCEDPSVANCTIKNNIDDEPEDILNTNQTSSNDRVIEKELGIVENNRSSGSNITVERKTGKETPIIVLSEYKHNPKELLQNEGDNHATYDKTLKKTNITVSNKSIEVMSNKADTGIPEKVSMKNEKKIEKEQPSKAKLPAENKKFEKVKDEGKNQKKYEVKALKNATIDILKHNISETVVGTIDSDKGKPNNKSSKSVETKQKLKVNIVEGKDTSPKKTKRETREVNQNGKIDFIVGYIANKTFIDSKTNSSIQNVKDNVNSNSSLSIKDLPKDKEVMFIQKLLKLSNKNVSKTKVNVLKRGNGDLKQDKFNSKVLKDGINVGLKNYILYKEKPHNKHEKSKTNGEDINEYIEENTSNDMLPFFETSDENEFLIEAHNDDGVDGDIPSTTTENIENEREPNVTFHETERMRKNGMKSINNTSEKDITKKVEESKNRNDTLLGFIVIPLRKNYTTNSGSNLTVHKNNPIRKNGMTSVNNTSDKDMKGKVVQIQMTNDTLLGFIVIPLRKNNTNEKESNLTFHENRQIHKNDMTSLNNTPDKDSNKKIVESKKMNNTFLGFFVIPLTRIHKREAKEAKKVEVNKSNIGSNTSMDEISSPGNTNATILIGPAIVESIESDGYLPIEITTPIDIDSKKKDGFIIPVNISVPQNSTDVLVKNEKDFKDELHTNRTTNSEVKKF